MRTAVSPAGQAVVASIGSQFPGICIVLQIHIETLINHPLSLRRVLDADIAEIALPIRLGHNLAALAEAASRDQRLKRAGYDAAADFVAIQLRAINPASLPSEERRS